MLRNPKKLNDLFSQDFGHSVPLLESQQLRDDRTQPRDFVLHGLHFKALDYQLAPAESVSIHLKQLI